MNSKHSESAATTWDDRHLRLAIKAAGVAMWSWNVDTDKLTMDERAFDMWDVPFSSEVCFEDLSSHIHPADRDRVGAAFAATRALVGPYEIDFRVIARQVVRWISARGQGDDSGIVGRIMYGIFLDVTNESRPRKRTNFLPAK